MWKRACLLAAILLGTAHAAVPTFDLLIRNGRVYDGSGRLPTVTDIGIKGDTIAAVGHFNAATAKQVIDAQGKAVAPGFINMLSGADEALIQDGRSQSDIRQGVTLEVMGEGSSMGPLNDRMKADLVESQGDIMYAVEWTTLADFLEHLTRRGVACNVASFVGAATIRIHELGYADRPPTPPELERMRTLVREAMEGGALGVSSALIYAPGYYAKTDELIELCKVAAAYDGLYISHMRSEGNSLIEALDEFLRIGQTARIRSEIYHFKAAGISNWAKLDEAIRRITKARQNGQAITANMYTYTAAATGLDASMPPWVQEGGYKEWARRLRDPAIRERVATEMRTRTDKWESLYLAAGSPTNVILAGFKNPSLKPFTGKTLAEVAGLRNKSPEETAMDLVAEDGSRVSTIYFVMAETNLTKEIALPWVSFCSDEGSYSAEGPFLKSNPHPRAYGTFARLLGRYVRDQKAIPLQEAIRKLTSLPAQNLRLTHRGRLAPGFFADVVIFDPAKIADHATYDSPQQYATGVSDVFVNGVQVLKDSEPTGATPGRALRGPGWKPSK